MTKEETIISIQKEIQKTEQALADGTFASNESDAMNRIAISNLYVALSNLIK